MEVIEGPEASVPPVQGGAVTIGAYDGVHLGHQMILKDLRERADQLGLVTEVVTFDRHPATVVRPNSAPLQLTDLEQKLELLAACGVDRTVVIPFDEARASETAEDFVSEVLVGALGARLVVVGSDFHFGHHRLGNVELLGQMGEKLGFEVCGVALKSDSSGLDISSTRIRELISEGRVEDAAVALGRYHELRGEVVRGDARGGSELGFPTANVAVGPGMALPKVGIYAGWYLQPDGTRHQAAVSLGYRPTFTDGAGSVPILLEAHLLDFDADLYNQRARIAFVKRLRDELRFDSVDDLIAQMERDVIDTRLELAQATGNWE
ncbi:MAG: bifunctional riboflavin kinase/FAD synthetase [Acidimicrobiales bacterium]